MEFKINNYPYFFEKNKAMVVYNLTYGIYVVWHTVLYGEACEYKCG
jgi:hypothetical protein